MAPVTWAAVNSSSYLLARRVLTSWGVAQKPVDSKIVHQAMIDMLELIWGEGYMAPGGADNVARMLDGFETRGKRVLDIGDDQSDGMSFPRASHGHST